MDSLLFLAVETENLSRIEEDARELCKWSYRKSRISIKKIGFQNSYLLKKKSRYRDAIQSENTWPCKSPTRILGKIWKRKKETFFTYKNLILVSREIQFLARAKWEFFQLLVLSTYACSFNIIKTKSDEFWLSTNKLKLVHLWFEI